MGLLTNARLAKLWTS
nr:unnamed protein product [Callosobruchus chinensis]